MSHFWGYSHAAALSPAVRDLALKQEMGIRQITKSAYPPLEGMTAWMPSHPLHASECASFNRAALESVLDDPSVKVVIIAVNWSAPIRWARDGGRYVPTDDPSRYVSEQTSEEDLKIGLTSLAGHLRSRGKSVILVEDNPIFDFNPLRWALIQKIPVRLKLVL
jgi:SGNH domain (fused to AT3 domains)